MKRERAAGILLHPTSLPGRFGIGDLGPAAFELCDRLREAGQTYWQILPLGPTGFGDSPYQSLSAFAGNTLLISPEKLVDDGFLSEDDLAGAPEFPTDRVDYGGVREWKESILRTAFERFENGDSYKEEFSHFCAEESVWLEDYSVYRAIKATHGESAWFQWPDDVRKREAGSLEAATRDLAGEIRYRQFCQFNFFRQWRALREHAASLGVEFIGDIPIFVALDSCDVWVRQGEFKLEPDGSPRVVAGVPPDYFSETGQLWGNPIYEWDAMRDSGFEWWVERFRHTLKMVDVVRIDHFRGFLSTWEVPGGDETAENGEWVDVPGRELFAALRERLGELPVIAEDLGAITPEVEALRDEFGFPGMRILEYGFGGGAGNRDLPHNYDANTVAYTGTHDNETAVGWFETLNDETRKQAVEYLAADDGEIAWAMIRGLYSSVATTVIVPLQDILGLGSEARMNTPATAGGNWRWRIIEDQLSSMDTRRLANLAQLFGRSG
jgi:4-alpha-glucanotransferase